MKNFKFGKTIKRKLFNIVFGGVGRRRLITDYDPVYKPRSKRTNLQKMRRAHQGWRNRVYGSMVALKIRKVFGRIRPASQLRR